MVSAGEVLAYRQFLTAFVLTTKIWSQADNWSTIYVNSDACGGLRNHGVNLNDHFLVLKKISEKTGNY